MILRKSLLYSTLLFSLLFSSVAFSGCDKDDDDNSDGDNYSLSGTANGANERPNPVTTNGTGNLTGSYNPTTKVLNYTITWTGLSSAPTMMHFHGPAGVDETASPVVNITNFTQAAAGTATGTATLDATQEADLLNGRWYYNIHTPANQPGEIRGQVAATR